MFRWKWSSLVVLKYYISENKNEYIDTKVLSLEGGLFKWATEDKPMINIHQKPTKYVHPYSTMLGQLLPKDRRSYTPEDW